MPKWSIYPKDPYVSFTGPQANGKYMENLMSKSWEDDLSDRWMY